MVSNVPKRKGGKKLTVKVKEKIKTGKNNSV